MTKTRTLFGLEPDKYTTNRLNINAGNLTDFYGDISMDFPQETQIDLTKAGLYGIDKLPVVSGELYVYCIRNADGVYGLLASQSRFEGGVVCPAGFIVQRKLPWGVMYNPSWGGIPNFHLTHWPLPQINFTDAEATALWTALPYAKSPTWADVDLSPWLPDNARLAYIICDSRYENGFTAGSSYIRSHGGQLTGQLVGSVSPGIPYQIVPMAIRVDSVRKMQYMTSGTGCRLIIRVTGYSMTEPA